MSKKKFMWLSGIASGVETIAVSTVTYFEPAYAMEINAAITLFIGTVVTICAKFVKPEQPTEK